MTTAVARSIKDNQKQCAFLEGVRRRCPDNRAVLEALGDLYTRVGRITDGLEIDEILTAKDPDNETYWYNLACSYSLTGQLADALAALRRSIDLGYRDATWMKQDKDLEALRGLPEFEAIIGSLSVGGEEVAEG